MLMYVIKLQSARYKQLGTCTVNATNFANNCGKLYNFVQYNIWSFLTNSSFLTVITLLIKQSQKKPKRKMEVLLRHTYIHISLPFFKFTSVSLYP